MIVFVNDNIDKTIDRLTHDHFRREKVFVRLVTERFVIAPNGEEVFGYFDSTNQTIYVATDLPEPERNVPRTIAREYRHFEQWCNGKPYSDFEADMFADALMIELGIV